MRAGCGAVRRLHQPADVHGPGRGCPSVPGRGRQEEAELASRFLLLDDHGAAAAAKLRGNAVRRRTLHADRHGVRARREAVRRAEGRSAASGQRRAACPHAVRQPLGRHRRRARTARSGLRPELRQQPFRLRLLLVARHRPEPRQSLHGERCESERRRRGKRVRRPGQHHGHREQPPGRSDRLRPGRQAVRGGR